MRIDQNSQLINAQMQPRQANAAKKAENKNEGIAAVVEKMHMDITDQGNGSVTNVGDAMKMAMSLKERLFQSAAQAVSAQANVNPEFVSKIV